MRHLHLDFSFREYTNTVNTHSSGILYGLVEPYQRESQHYQLFAQQLHDLLMAVATLAAHSSEAAGSSSSGVDKVNLNKDLKATESILMQQLPRLELVLASQCVSD